MVRGREGERNGEERERERGNLDKKVKEHQQKASRLHDHKFIKLVLAGTSDLISHSIWRHKKLIKS